MRLAEEIENQLTPTEQNLRDNFKNELGIDKTSRYHDLIGILAVSSEELPKIVAQLRTTRWCASMIVAKLATLKYLTKVANNPPIFCTALDNTFRQYSATKQPEWNPQQESQFVTPLQTAEMNEKDEDLTIPVRLAWLTGQRLRDLLLPDSQPFRGKSTISPASVRPPRHTTQSSYDNQPTTAEHSNDNQPTDCRGRNNSRHGPLCAPHGPRLLSSAIAGTRDAASAEGGVGLHFPASPCDPPQGESPEACLLPRRRKIKAGLYKPSTSVAYGEAASAQCH